ncbi:aspartate/glutamate racemase family protein [Microvirga puerhi]|uniref:Aspartate/glutamate racemase family protein n=1 Tax=Microvirga puerhi TaxID=2876078 RepID=A0ABS7VNG9_9HYPH|nr:aspartate/glutamate racemase family protein [Microvirga puerhi]MBZ6077039.1 aspartate/glutamate racemase family protein [Microvirga puerhi]
MRIACLHTADSNIAVFENAATGEAYTHGTLTHTVRPDLLAKVEQGGFTEALESEIAAILLELTVGADAVILTCSSIGPAAAVAATQTHVPVLRVDEALAQATAHSGRRAIVLIAAPTTLEPTRALFDAAAQAVGTTVETSLVPKAWDLFKGGDRSGYLAMIAEAADRAFAEGFETVALAQASMMDAVDLCRGGRPLTSPDVGLSAAMAASLARAS